MPTTPIGGGIGKVIDSLQIVLLPYLFNSYPYDSYDYRDYRDTDIKSYWSFVRLDVRHSCCMQQSLQQYQCDGCGGA